MFRKKEKHNNNNKTCFYFAPRMSGSLPPMSYSLFMDVRHHDISNSYFNFGSVRYLFPLAPLLLLFLLQVLQRNATLYLKFNIRLNVTPPYLKIATIQSVLQKLFWTQPNVNISFRSKFKPQDMHTISIKCC